MRKRFCIGFLFVCLLNWTAAQEVQLNLDSSRYLIGDWIKAGIQISVPEKLKVTFPDIYNSWSEFEIISISETDTVQKDGKLYFSFEVVLSQYDTGYFPLPPLTFHSIDANGKRDSFSTEPQLVQIMGVAIDTTSMEPKDIKDILQEKITFKEILKRFFWIPLVLLLLVLLYFLYKKWKSKPITEKVETKEKVPSHIAALQALEDLKEKKLWHKGQVKEYYIELSDIIRTYIEERFNSPALESTSDEIISNLKRKSIDKGQIEKLSFMLKTADLAKFAKFNPLSDENEQCFDIARGFVIQTKEEEIKGTENV